MADPIKKLDLNETQNQEIQTTKESYVHKSLVAIDQTVNVITGGYPDETISSRAARADEQGKLWGRYVSKFLNLFQSDHGAIAQAGDLERAEEVEKLEEKSGGITEEK